MPTSTDPSFPRPNVEALRLRLARLRHERGFSYNELAARSGVGRSTLVYLESGASNRNPDKPATSGNVETWYRIAKALEVDLGELLDALDEPSNTQP